jgi:hypothetical protein
VFLRKNCLAGGFPQGLFDLAQLRRLDLADNRLAGGLPLGFNRLARLDELFLEGNDLAGALPTGLDLSGIAPGSFNVTFNAGLSGPVPASLARMPASAFLGTGLCGGPLPPCATPPSPPLPSSGGDGKSGKLSRRAIVGIIVGVVVVVLLVMAIVGFLRRRRRQAQESPTRSAPVAAANVHAGTPPVTVKLARTERDAVVSGDNVALALGPAARSGDDDRQEGAGIPGRRAGAAVRSGDAAARVGRGAQQGRLRDDVPRHA